jgi:hypothetical protein
MPCAECDDKKKPCDCMGTMHHPSCRPSDVSLMRVCGQCGAQEDASDVEAALAAKDERIKELEDVIDGLRSFKRGVDAALNSGDGSYHP